MCKRYSERPSVLLCVDDPYTAYCIDEACCYALCAIEEKGSLPAELERFVSGGAADPLTKYKNMKGVDFIDNRRNRGGISHP